MIGKRGVKPLSINLFPLSFEGEGDKGGKVSKQSQGVDWNSRQCGKIVKYEDSIS